ELACAQAIDSLREVRFWLRNVARHPASFRLPTATGFFYPDFVAELEDGRLLVVEYKGDLTAELADTDRKRAIGRKWEEVSRGKGLFILVERELDGRGPAEQLRRRIAR